MSNNIVQFNEEITLPLKTAVRLWLPLGKTPVISAYPKLKKERY